jgi:branched-chain amino acid transport system permease protein
MRQLLQKRWRWPFDKLRVSLIGLVLFVILALLPLFLSQSPRGEYYLHILILVMMYAYLSTAWNILGGYAGQHSLGHGLFLGTGAYVSTMLFLKLGLTPWVGMWIGGAAAALLGWFVGYVCFRYGLKGAYFALVTIALAEAAGYLTTNIRWLGGSLGLEVTWMGHEPLLMQFKGKAGYYYIILVMTAMSILYTIWLNRRRFGYYLVAVRENEEAADALGVDPLKVKIQSTVVSAFMTALGGTFFAQYFTYIHPKMVFGEGPSVQILLFSIIGGLGTVWGPSVGAVVLVPVAEWTRSQFGGTFAGAHLLFYGAILVVVMLFMPYGIVGLAQSLWGKLWARSAGEDSPHREEMEGER